ncbi:hypothetical protein N7462_002627 [Penicillium macrosclerotiorum]|uniref:uncharacterized protein n=1 Tax=Penicillium macrosclerotiorum TaxID=303699 RepID=UPI002548D3E9|nr:uncharacterized protein N7462_002627 [Penicillium macrosclerotiorum]KAJ5693204.1 hypothetical protein N7462_002627 [Penicillium macrosclerotiorum]
METPHLRLEQIDLSHLEEYHRVWVNPATTKWTSRGPSKTIEESKEKLTGILPDNNRPGVDNHVVFIREPPADDNEGHWLIGVVGVHRTDPVPELGYLFHPSAWGKGYATESVAAFVKHYFTIRPEANVIEAKVDTKNFASIRVLQKCGFVEEETIVGGAQQAWLDPPVRDLVVYRLRREI